MFDSNLPAWGGGRGAAGRETGADGEGAGRGGAETREDEEAAAWVPTEGEGAADPGCGPGTGIEGDTSGGTPVK